MSLIMGNQFQNVVQPKISNQLSKYLISTLNLHTIGPISTLMKIVPSFGRVAFG